MKYLSLLKAGLPSLLMVFVLPVYAGETTPVMPAIIKSDMQVVTPYNMAVFDKDIMTLYRNVPGSNARRIHDRVSADSEFFLGKPYVLGPLGEGVNGRYDQNPLYRTDVFDCQSFVETIIALANSEDLEQFRSAINQVRYRDGHIKFQRRNHFPSVDWNRNNAFNGYLEDITFKIVDHQGEPVALIADADINKAGWYAKLPANRIKLSKKLNAEQQKTRVAQLHALGQTRRIEKSVLLYLPLNKLFDAKGKANKFIFDQIPSGSVIEIVRPNWDIKNIIGTNMNVSHMGLAIRNAKNELIYREASSIDKKVIDVPLDEYLKNYIDSPTIKGIHVARITAPPILRSALLSRNAKIDE